MKRVVVSFIGVVLATVLPLPCKAANVVISSGDYESNKVKWAATDLRNKTLEAENNELKSQNEKIPKLSDEIRMAERDITEIKPPIEFLYCHACREWTNKKSEKKIEALLISDNGQEVELQTKDGKKRKIKRDILTDADIEWIEKSKPWRVNMKEPIPPKPAQGDAP